MSSAAVMLLAHLCGADPHQTLRLSNPGLMMPEPAQRGMVLLLAVFGSFQPYEFVYKNEKNKPYRVRVRLPDFILNNNGHKPDLVIAACTRVG